MCRVYDSGMGVRYTRSQPPIVSSSDLRSSSSRCAICGSGAPAATMQLSTCRQWFGRCAAADSASSSSGVSQPASAAGVASRGARMCSRTQCASATTHFTSAAFSPARSGGNHTSDWRTRSRLRFTIAPHSRRASSNRW